MCFEYRIEEQYKKLNCNKYGIHVNKNVKQLESE